MQANHESSQTRRLPTWLIASFWSVAGVLAALLTIFILTVSLLWLLRWTNPAGSWTSSTGPAGTGAAVSPGPVNSSANQTSPAVQLTTEAAARPKATRSALERSSEATRQPTPVSPGAGQAEPVLTAKAETAGAPASALTQQAAVTASVTTAATGPGQQSDQSTQPPLPQAVTEPSGESQVVSTLPGQGDQPGRPAEQSSAPGSANITVIPESAPAGSTSTPTVSPSATPSPSPTNNPTPTPTPTPVPEPQEYIVQDDDWLSRLADKFYGDLLAYPAIVEATNVRAAVDDSYTFITDPDVIEIGQKLWIPTPEEAAVLLAEEE